MNATESSNTSPTKSRWRRPLLIGALVTGIGGALLAGGCHRAHAHGWGGGHGHHAMDPQAASERAEFAADWALNKVNASEAQRQQVKAILKSAVADLMPQREQHRAARKAMMELLAQPSIDKPKLEELRRAELQRAENVSQRLMQAITDAAEVLTPEQRAELAKLASRHRG